MNRRARTSMQKIPTKQSKHLWHYLNTRLAASNLQISHTCLQGVREIRRSLSKSWRHNPKLSSCSQPQAGTTTFTDPAPYHHPNHYPFRVIHHPVRQERKDERVRRDDVPLGHLVEYPARVGRAVARRIECDERVAGEDVQRRRRRPQRRAAEHAWSSSILVGVSPMVVVTTYQASALEDGHVPSRRA